MKGEQHAGSHLPSLTSTFSFTRTLDGINADARMRIRWCMMSRWPFSCVP